MYRTRIKYAFKIFAVICIFMQIAVMLPHHHHSASGIACVNPFHCYLEEAEQACGSCCQSSHSHSDYFENGHFNDFPLNHTHDNAQDDCTFNHIDFLIPSRDNDNIIAHANIISETDVFTVGSVADPCGECANENYVRISVRINRRIEPVGTQYYAVALPPRAPSFSVIC